MSILRECGKLTTAGRREGQCQREVTAAVVASAGQIAGVSAVHPWIWTDGRFVEVCCFSTTGAGRPVTEGRGQAKRDHTWGSLVTFSERMDLFPFPFHFCGAFHSILCAVGSGKSHLAKNTESDFSFRRFLRRMCQTVSRHSHSHSFRGNQKPHVWTHLWRGEVGLALGQPWPFGVSIFWSPVSTRVTAER